MPRRFVMGLCLLSALGFAGQEDRLEQAVRDKDHRTLQALVAQHADPNRLLADKSTVLAWAVDREDEEAVGLLLAAGAKPNIVDEYGIVPLTLACEHGQSGIVTKLLKAGADAKAVRADGVTALELCAAVATPEVVEQLLSSGADVNAADFEKHQTALMWAASQGKTANMDVLIKHGADVNAKTAGGFVPLFFALQSKDPKAPVLLLDNGANLSYVDPSGNSAMQIALLAHNVPFATLLVERGAASLEARDRTGSLLIHAAASSGNANFVKVLLAKGADPNALTQPPAGGGRGRGPGGPPRGNAPPAGAPGAPPVPDAAVPPGPGGRGGNADQAGASPAPPAAGRGGGGGRGGFGAPAVPMTPLLLAAKAGATEVMKILVAAGAKPSFKAQDGTSLLLAAAGGGKLDSLQYAFGLDAEFGADQGGQTAMHLAANNGQAVEAEAVIQFLADKGAKLDAKDARGRTPLDILLQRGPDNVKDLYLRILKEHGIAVSATANQ
jgi:ankyrin repeat protein